MTARDTILAIDDDRGIAALMRDELDRAGHRVLVADSATETLRRLRALQVQLVITDAPRPGHAADPWKTLVISFGHEQHDYAARAAHGYAASLPKPFDTAELTAIVSSLRPVGGRPTAQSHSRANQQLV